MTTPSVMPAASANKLLRPRWRLADDHRRARAPERSQVGHQIAGRHISVTRILGEHFRDDSLEFGRHFRIQLPQRRRLLMKNPFVRFQKSRA